MAPKKAEGKKPEEDGPRVYVKISVSPAGCLLVSFSQPAGSLCSNRCRSVLAVAGST